MLKDWMTEIRPKSLLLAGTNCLLGCALGFFYGDVSFYTVFVASLVILTGILLQILCNFADDYGDALKNADGPNRKGPIRAVMLGNISLSTLRKAMVNVVIASVFCGALSLYLALGDDLEKIAWFCFGGVFAIFAAITYTVGMAYGYKSLGDISVFIFFGLAAVMGSQFLIMGASQDDATLFPDTVLISIAVGLQSVMVLQVASMRDIDEDRLNKKITLAARLGHGKSALYLVLLMLLSFVFSELACLLNHKVWAAIILAIAMLPLLACTMRCVKNRNDAEKIGRERKYCLLGCAIHNIVWCLLLTMEFWFYF